VIIGIDYGTTFTGVSCSYLFERTLPSILLYHSWPDSRSFTLPDDLPTKQRKVRIAIETMEQQRKQRQVPTRSPTQRARWPSPATSNRFQGQRPWHCSWPGCKDHDKPWNIRSALRKHERTHLPVETSMHACSDCGKQFWYPKDVARHCKEEHQRDLARHTNSKEKHQRDLTRHTNIPDLCFETHRYEFDRNPTIIELSSIEQIGDSVSCHFRADPG